MKANHRKTNLSPAYALAQFCKGELEPAFVDALASALFTAINDHHLMLLLDGEQGKQITYAAHELELAYDEMTTKEDRL